MIRDNLIYKLVALAVAVGLWMYVNSERNPVSRKSFSTPVVTQNLMRGFVAEPGAPEVSVSIEGPKSLVEGVRKEDISAWVDLEGFTTAQPYAEKLFKVETRVVGLPSSGVSYTVNPHSVKVRIEALGGKRMPVEVKFLSAPPIGKNYGNPTVTPPNVSIAGKSTDVGRVRRVVLAVSNEAMTGSIDSEFPLTPMDQAGNAVSGVTVDPERVRLKLNLVEVPAKKQFMVSAALEGSPKYPNKVSEVKVSPSVVTLEGMPKILERVGTVTTEPVSVEGAEGDVVKHVGLRVPAGCQVEGTGQVRVNVSISSGQ
jgi:YbbR domain-containing protein